MEENEISCLEGHIPDCTCAICHEPLLPAEIITFDNTELCEDCFASETATCDWCGNRIWSDDNAGGSNRTLCQRCYDRDFTSCDCCGNVIHVDDAYTLDDDGDCYYCYDCYQEKKRQHNIHDYYFKPEPIFHGEGRYFGIELEIDSAGERQDYAAKILEIANQKNENLYIKHDGSLNDGMELVSHPMTLEYHTKEMPWAAIMAKAKGLGFLSHQTSTCGLHIHVNRSSFGETEAEQEECIARVLFFVETHWPELLRFSRRTQRQIEQWAARYGVKDSPKDILKHAKSSSGSRYTCINLTNYNTIEFRIFRGTLKYNTFIATLQLVSRICEYAACLDDSEFQTLSWSSFVAGCSDLPELVQYLRERRLYVSDPIGAEEEV